MYYIIQENIFRESHYNLLIETMEKLKLPYQVVRVFPFVEKVVDIKNIPKNNDFNLDELPEIEPNTTEKIFTFGSVKMSRLCAQKNWQPGSLLNANHDFEVYSKYYKENLLNYDSEITNAGGSINWNTTHKFIRPTKDTKSFTGRVFNQEDWEQVLDENFKNRYSLLKETTTIQVSSVKTIYQEIRFWVIGGKVITGSRYKFGNRIEYSEYFEKEALEYAQKMVDIYQLADAFVIDVCLTDDGWKIVECNCINCAGFYLCNIQKVIMELEYYFNPKKFLW
jgi:hypothetical protein